MLLVQSRRPARMGSTGDLVRLADQVAASGTPAARPRGTPSCAERLARNQPGSYQIQAAIDAVHADARTAAETDWPQIVVLYDQLVGLTPTPIVALNRAVAVAEVQGPAAALRLVETLPLVEMHLWHAIRADLLRRLGRAPEAAEAYAAAIGRAGNARERAFLQRQCDGLRVSYRS